MSETILFNWTTQIGLGTIDRKYSFGCFAIEKLLNDKIPRVNEWCENCPPKGSHRPLRTFLLIAWWETLLSISFLIFRSNSASWYPQWLVDMRRNRERIWLEKTSFFVEWSVHQLIWMFLCIFLGNFWLNDCQTDFEGHAWWLIIY